MQKFFRLALMTALLAILMVSPALAKKAPVERTVVDGVTLAEVKTNSQVSPYYPATARPSKAYGEVVVAVEVDEKGKVSGVDVLSSIGEDLGFEVSAKDAVRQWRFLPALKDGEPISSISMLRLTFAPPSMAAPDGRVFTETSSRFYGSEFRTLLDPQLAAAAGLDNARSLINPFGDETANHDPRDRIIKADLPPCPARRNYNECMYDKYDMVQFGGMPENHPIPVSGNK
jgi:protein TonB